ncbi:MAG: LVIVD repeat-containing protein, partial [Burkholderiaceae bacterium]
IGESGHVEATNVTEWDEPQAVKGSYLQRYAYPDWYRAHQERKMELTESHSHATNGAAGCLQLRGEYLFVAEGKGGLRVYDTASIANKDVSQRIITAPYSPLGHDTHVASRNATCMALPTNQPIAPSRNQGELIRDTNQEQAFHPIYHYAVVTDAEEGLFLVNVDTLADGDARNNFLKRAVTWNPNGLLNGARHITLGGHYAYITTTVGLVIVDLDDPLKPRHVATIALEDARASALQFRYLFVTDKSGLRVIDVTQPTKPVLLATKVNLADAHKLYLARTYAYVAAGTQGLAIIDIEKPVEPRLHQFFNADGQLNDAQDVIVGSTNASLFAYVADGKNGLKVLQLTAPDTQPRFYGFSPDPKPQLIAWRKTKSAAMALSKGLDRDRAVDETGNQIAVFGRIGSRPFNAKEMQKLYLNPNGEVWSVSDRGDSRDFVNRPNNADPTTQKGVK